MTRENPSRIMAIISNVSGIMRTKRWTIAACLVGILAVAPAPYVNSKTIHPTRPQIECIHCCDNKFQECKTNQGWFSKDPAVCKADFVRCEKGCVEESFCFCCQQGILGCSGSRFSTLHEHLDTDAYAWCGMEGTYCSGPSPPCRR
jgi:hypothetical protein